MRLKIKSEKYVFIVFFLALLLNPYQVGFALAIYQFNGCGDTTGLYLDKSVIDVNFQDLALVKVNDQLSDLNSKAKQYASQCVSISLSKVNEAIVEINKPLIYNKKYYIYVDGTQRMSFDTGNGGGTITKKVNLRSSCDYKVFAYSINGDSERYIIFETTSCATATTPSSPSSSSCPDEDTIINAFFQKITTIKDTDVCGGSMSFSYSESGKTYTFAAYYNYGYDKLTIEPVNSEAQNCFSQPIVVNNVRNSDYLPDGTTFDYCSDKFLQALKNKNIQCCGDQVDFVEVNGNRFGVTVEGYRYSINNYPVSFTCGDIGVLDCGDCNGNSAALKGKEHLENIFSKFGCQQINYRSNGELKEGYICYKGISVLRKSIAGDYNSQTVIEDSLADILTNLSDSIKKYIGASDGPYFGIDSDLKATKFPHIFKYFIDCSGYSKPTCTLEVTEYIKCEKDTKGTNYFLKLSSSEYYSVTYSITFEFSNTNTTNDEGGDSSGGGSYSPPPPPPCEPSSVSASISGCPDSVSVGDSPVTLIGSPSGISNSWTYSGQVDFQESGTTLTISNFNKKGTVTAEYSVTDDDGCGGTTSDSDTCTFDIKGLVPKIKYSIQPTSPNCGDQVNITIEVYDDKYGTITSSRSNFSADVTIFPSVYDNIGSCGVKGNNPCWFTINTNRLSDIYSTIVFAQLDPDDPDAWENTQISQTINFNCNGAICNSDAYITPISGNLSCGNQISFKGVCGRNVNGVILPINADIVISKNGNILKSCSNTKECNFTDTIQTGQINEYNISCSYDQSTGCSPISKIFYYSCMNTNFDYDKSVFISDISCFDENNIPINCTKVYANQMIYSCNGVSYPVLNYVDCIFDNVSKINCSLKIINKDVNNKTVNITFAGVSKIVNLKPCYNLVNIYKNNISLDPNRFKNLLITMLDNNSNYYQIMNMHILNKNKVVLKTPRKIKSISEYENKEFYILLIIIIIILLIYLKTRYGEKNA